MPQEEIVLICERCHGELEKIKEGSYKCKMCGGLKEIQTTTSAEILTLINEATRLRGRGDFDESFDVCREIIKKDPKNPEGYWGAFLSEYGIQHEEDPKTKRYVPTCHRISRTNVYENADLKKCLELSTESQRENYKKDADEIEQIRSKIVKISDNEPPYDVFICYKRTASIVDGEEYLTQDASSAHQIYDSLTAEGYRVFFAEATLSNVAAGLDYEPIIFNALNTSRVMLVVCSKPEYINATWVKNEWRRFLKLMEHDDSKKIIPIMQNMSPAKLPDLLKKYQALTISPKFESELIANVSRIVSSANKVNLQRVSFDQKKATKKSNVVKANIEARTIQAKEATQLVASEQVKIRNAWKSLDTESYDTAIDFFYDLLTNPKLVAICEFTLSYIRCKLNSSGIDKKLLGTNYDDLKNKALAKCLIKKTHFVMKNGIADGYLDDLVSKFNACVENSDQETLNIVFAKMKDLFFNCPNLEVKSKLYYAISSWESDIKNDIFQEACKIVSENLRDTQIIFETIAKCYDANDVDGYIGLLEKFASDYLSKAYFKFAINAYDKILEVDEGNVKARWNKFLAIMQIPVIARLRYVTHRFDDEKIELLKDYVLAYCTDAARANYLKLIKEELIKSTKFTNKKYKFQKEFVHYLTLLYAKSGYTAFDYYLTECNYNGFVRMIKWHQKRYFKGNDKDDKIFDAVKIDDVLAKFDKINTFYPESKESVVLANIREVANLLLNMKLFDKARKYYQQLVGQNNKDTDAYFGLLKCDLKCVTDGDLTWIKTPLKDMPNFNNAVNSVPETDEAKVEYYYNLESVRRAHITNHDKRPKPIKQKETVVTGSPSDATGSDKNAKKYKWMMTNTAVKALIYLGVFAVLFLIVGGFALYKTNPSFLATRVSNSTEFQEMVQKGKGKYVLTNDIDLTELGIYSDKTSRECADFSGKLYGNGYTVKNSANNSSEENSSLFRYLYKATIQNLVIDINFNFSDEFDKEFYAGLASKAFNSTIKNVTVKGTFEGRNVGKVGGIIGYAENCKIQKCTSEANITAEYYVGGIVGEMRGSKIQNCTNKGNVTAVGNQSIYVYVNETTYYNMACVGGIVGYGNNSAYRQKNYTKNYVWTKLKYKSKDSSITGCENTGAIAATYDNNVGVGGILGFSDLYFEKVDLKRHTYHAAKVNNCKNGGTISGDCFIGGIVGGTNGNVTNCENNGEVIGDWYVSGVVGWAYNTSQKIKITNDINTGKISGCENLGGVIGGFTSDLFNCEINNLTNRGEIVLNTSIATDYQDIGGVIGWMSYSCENKIKHLNNYGTLSVGTTAVQRIGGVIGCVEGIHKLIIRNCANNISISATNSTYVGGIVGNIASGKYSDGTGVYFSGLKQIGSVTGKDYVGGGFGSVDAGYIDNSTGRFTLIGTITAAGSHKGSLKGNKD